MTEPLFDKFVTQVDKEKVAIYFLEDKEFIIK